MRHLPRQSLKNVFLRRRHGAIVDHLRAPGHIAPRVHPPHPLVGLVRVMCIAWISARVTSISRIDDQLGQSSDMRGDVVG